MMAPPSDDCVIPIPHCGTHATRRDTNCVHCHIRHLTICGAFEPAELPHVERVVTHRHIQAGRQLFEEGTAPDYAYNLVEGAIRLYKLLGDGRRQIIGFALPGDFIGLAIHEKYSYSAEAVTNASICCFKRRDLSELFRSFPQMEHRVLSLTNDELAAAQEQMMLLGRKTPVEKVASFLFTLSKRLERLGTGGEALSLPMTRADIADFLGLTIETVSRSFTKLKNAHAIALPTPDQVQIAAIDRLEAVARGDAL
jgi:CRP/FNR family transcriptional regulator